MSNPAVSVILPVYNGENYLRFALESVLNQTFRDLELIVVDDGSADSTPSIVQAYGDRIRYVRQKNGGVGAAFNHGLRLATGRYISWLSHDDAFLPTKLEKQVGALARTSAPAVCYTDLQMIDAGGNVISEQKLPEYGRGDALRHVLTAGPICSASYSIMYDRRCVEQVGVYDESLRYTQDVDMLARLAMRFPMIRVPEALMQMREHERRETHSERWEREVLSYLPSQLDAIPFEELFPDPGRAATKAERARAYRWLGDQFASHPFPPYRKIARTQYMKALSADPAIMPSLVQHYAVSFLRRHPRLYGLGLRTAFARRFSSARQKDLS